MAGRGRTPRDPRGGLSPTDASAQAARLTRAFHQAAKSHPGDEAGFRAVAERALEEVAAERGVELDTHRELTLAAGRADAVFNRLIVEWEPPGALAAHVGHPGNRHAVEQLRRYVDGLAARERRELATLAGVACDGHYLIFARYRAGRWIVDEPTSVDGRSAELLLDSLVAAQTGKALTARNLLREFGPDAHLTRQLGRALIEQLRAQLGQHPDELPARMYEQWRTFFAVATGVVGESDALKGPAQAALADLFGLRPRDLEPAQGLFALHTYFVLVTKLVSLLALSLWVPGVSLDLDEMASSGDDDLWEDLDELQRGAPFREAGLVNVVEPDVFGWYLDWSPQVRDGVREVVTRLKDYDLSTLHVSPEDTRDLLKDLYQGLLPRPVRHALGQYFTPDWLAEQLLDSAEYQGQPTVRIVDPACGTGTFLVLGIQRLKEQLLRRGASDEEALATVLDNVVGFDIDPLATVAARSNYVLALGNLLHAARGASVDIPVYLADSVVAPSLGDTLLVQDRLVLETVAGSFALPTCIDTSEELRAVCDLAARGLSVDWDPERYVKEAVQVCDAKAADAEILRDSLPRPYRERTRPLWEQSGLFVHGGMAAMLGAGKKDMAMLMSYVATDRLLAKGGRLAFVITQTVFKTAGAGQGFRRFRVGDSGPAIQVEQVDDLVDLNPFVGATNRTALVTWRRDEPTRYPVRYVIWQRRAGSRIDPAATRDMLEADVRRLRLVAAPVRSADRTSAWLTAPRRLLPALRKLAETGEAAYTAHEGVNTGGANGVYWLTVDGEADENGLIPVSNSHDIGKRLVQRRYARIEQELVHPLIRGGDIGRWQASPSRHILLAQDPGTRRGIDEETMASDYPAALAFLTSFERDLRARNAFKRYFTRRAREGDIVETGPFWSMFNVGSYTLAEHKVVWKDQASEFAAAVMPRDAPVPLPNHKLILVACESDAEAHFLCGVLNSLPVRLFVASYAVETQISTHTVQYIHVPKFDGANTTHAAVVRASRAAHKAVAAGREPNEQAVNDAAAVLWGLSDDEIAAMRAFHDKLRKRDLTPNG